VHLDERDVVPLGRTPFKSTGWSAYHHQALRRAGRPRTPHGTVAISPLCRPSRGAVAGLLEVPATLAARLRAYAQRHALLEGHATQLVFEQGLAELEAEEERSGRR
jgi:hypothetical protein